MKKIFFLVLLFLFPLFIQSQIREIHLLNHNWNFAFGFEVKPDLWRRVELPHTWNAEDALHGKIDYYRGQATYEKKIVFDKAWAEKRLFLKFDGVNTVANIFLNGKHIGEHRGGYTAFVFEITDKVTFGEENTLQVRVSNALQLDVMPLVGDFNFYGGIYRDVNLIITNNSCISLHDYASSGVYLIQKKITKEKADVIAKILVSNGKKPTGKYEVKVEVRDGTKLVLTRSAEIDTKATEQIETVIPLQIDHPKLWNGRKNPFMYSVIVSLLQNGIVIDAVQQPMGLRFFEVNAEKGFFLNGEHLQLRGVCRHQDRSEIGNALLQEHHQEDVDIMLDMGANAIRMSHYPQAPCFMDLLDKKGIVAWSEIPFVGPGGYRGQGFVNQLSFCENGKMQLMEMIRQNFNRPSICFWGLFNELKMDGDNPTDYIRELNRLAKSEDPSRITTAASAFDGEINEITDLICWNRYFGWYGGDPSDIGKWADEAHKQYPNFKIGVSEYGAGASIYHHDQVLTKPTANSYWHPEEWQAFYHEENWHALNERPFLWGTFVWVLFDFASSHRTEGNSPGINDKGLVTFDRKVKKDAWWFYKASWNTTDPVVYIANRRFVNRTNPITSIKVYSNLPSVELFVNGKSMGKKNVKTVIYLWENILLEKGKNTIEVKSTNGKNTVSDSCIWTLE